MDPFEPGPYERIGMAVSTLTQIRTVLYGEPEEALLQRAENSPAPYAFAYGSLRGNLIAAKHSIDTLWGDLVSIERALMPTESAEVEW